MQIINKKDNMNRKEIMLDIARGKITSLKIKFVIGDIQYRTVKELKEPAREVADAIERTKGFCKVSYDYTYDD
jgi:hypothetical protein